MGIVLDDLQTLVLIMPNFFTLKVHSN